MKKLFALVATLMLTVGLMLIAVPQALACVPAKFSLEVTPTTVEEGGQVRITVTADNPSDGTTIVIETVDEIAKTGQDYTGIPKQRLSFGAIGQSQKSSYEFIVPVANDSTTEPAETFKVRLSDPRTCANGPGGSMPDGVVAPEPVRVTIAANNAVSTPPATSPAPKASLLPSPSVATSASPTVTPTSPSSGAASAEETSVDLPGALGAESSPPSPDVQIQTQGKSGGSSKVAIIVIAVLVGTGAGFGIWKRRRT